MHPPINSSYWTNCSYWISGAPNVASCCCCISICLCCRKWRVCLSVAYFTQLLDNSCFSSEAIHMFWKKFNKTMHLWSENPLFVSCNRVEVIWSEFTQLRSWFLNPPDSASQLHLLHICSFFFFFFEETYKPLTHWNSSSSAPWGSQIRPEWIIVIRFVQQVSDKGLLLSPLMEVGDYWPAGLWEVPSSYCIAKLKTTLDVLAEYF